MTPDRIREERLRAERCLDLIRTATAVLLRCDWDVPRLQKLGIPLTVILRLGNEEAPIIRRQCAIADLRMSELHAQWLIAHELRWLPLARQAFEAALRDKEILHRMRAECDVGAQLAAALSAAE